MPFATTAAVKLCVRIARRVATRPRVAIMAVAPRPSVRIVRRVVAPMLVCTAVVPPSLDAPPAAPPATVPPVIVTAPPYVPPYVLPPGAILPPGPPMFLPPSTTVPGVPGSNVPEPSTALLILSALGALVIFRRPM